MEQTNNPNAGVQYDMVVGDGTIVFEPLSGVYDGFTASRITDYIGRFEVSVLGKDDFIGAIGEAAAVLAGAVETCQSVDLVVGSEGWNKLAGFLKVYVDPEQTSLGEYVQWPNGRVYSMQGDTGVIPVYVDNRLVYVDEMKSGSLTSTKKIWQVTEEKIHHWSMEHLLDVLDARNRDGDKLRTKVRKHLQEGKKA